MKPSSQKKRRKEADMETATCDEEHGQDDYEGALELQSKQSRNGSEVIKVDEKAGEKVALGSSCHSSSGSSTSGSSCGNSSCGSGSTSTKEISLCNPAKSCSEKGYYMLVKVRQSNVCQIRLLDAMTNEVLWSTVAQEGYEFTYNPTRNMMIGSCRAGKQYIWDLGTGQRAGLVCRYVTEASPLFNFYSVSSTGDRMLVFNATTVEILDLIELSSLLFISGFINLARVCFSGDGSHVICDETGLGIIVVYSAVNGKKVSSFRAAFIERDLVCSLNGVYCGAHSYGCISVWDIQTGELQLCIDHKAGCFCFGKDDEYLVAIQCYSRRITTWALATGDMLFDGFVSSVLYLTPLIHFSVSASAVVLRGHGDGGHYTLEIDPLTGNEMGRGDVMRDKTTLPLKMYVRGALSILL
jgi:hypothetical protein